MIGLGIDFERIHRRALFCDYVTVAQLFLRENVLLERPLTFDDIKPRLLGHWGACPGINFVYANLSAYFAEKGVGNAVKTEFLGKNSLKTAGSGQKIAGNTENLPENRQKLGENAADFTENAENSPATWQFVLGSGHGFPALQANLWLDGILAEADANAARDETGLKYICRKFSAPDGFQSHANPATPGVICEGGELGYALASAFGVALGHPEKTVCVLIGDGELETGTALASLNLVKLLGGEIDTENLGNKAGAGDERINNINHARANGLVIPILNLNGYKISGPSVYGRKSERELAQLVRGFGFSPLFAGGSVASFQEALAQLETTANPLIVLRTEKGATGPELVDGRKIAGTQNAHQIPLPEAKTDAGQLRILEQWLRNYHFDLAEMAELAEDGGGVDAGKQDVQNPQNTQNTQDAGTMETARTTKSPQNAAGAPDMRNSSTVEIAEMEASA